MSENIDKQNQDTPVIQLRNVTISHEDGPLLSNVNFEVKRGEFVYLIGKSGAGKTSLLRSLYVDREVEEGELLVCGYDLTSIKNRQIPMLRRRIGIVFQNFRLLDDRCVYDNLEFVLRATGWKNKAEIDAQVMKVLNQVGVAHKAAMYPHRLSEGEQQRVGIARALINNPDLILADEPTGNLDPITSSEIMELLININRDFGITMVISSHDFMMMDKYQSRVVCCHEGALVEPQ